MPRWHVLLLAAAIALVAGCSSSRSAPFNPRDGGDSNISFPDAWGDLFVPPEGSSLRGELSSGGAAMEGGGYVLFGLVGEPLSSEPVAGGGYALQWDSVTLPGPQSP